MHWVIRSDVPVGIKDGRDQYLIPLVSPSASESFDKFLQVRHKACWEAPTKLFGFRDHYGFHLFLIRLSLVAGFPGGFHFRPDSFREGAICTRVLQNYLARDADARNKDEAVQAELYTLTAVAPTSIMSFVGTRFDHLQRETRAFDQLSSSDLHPVLQRFPLQGPFRKNAIGKAVVASPAFMEELSNLESAILGEAPQRSPPRCPSTCREFCKKIGRNLLHRNRQHEIHPSMTRVLNHLLSTGKHLDEGCTKGLLVFCMTSSGELDATNWKEAAVPEWMENYFNRGLLSQQKIYTVNEKPAHIVNGSPDWRKTTKHYQRRQSRHLKVTPYVDVNVNGSRKRLPIAQIRK